MSEVDAKEVSPKFAGAVDTVAENEKANRQKIEALRVPSDRPIQSIQNFLIYLTTCFWIVLIAWLGGTIVKVGLEIKCQV